MGQVLGETLLQGHIVFNVFKYLGKTFLLAVILSVNILLIYRRPCMLQHTVKDLILLLFHYAISKYDILNVIKSVRFNNTNRLNVLVSVEKQE